MDKKKKVLTFGGIALIVIVAVIILLLVFSKSENERAYNKVRKYLENQDYSCEGLGDGTVFCDAPNAEKETQYFELYFDDDNLNLNYWVKANGNFMFVTTKDSAIVKHNDDIFCKYKIVNDSNVILEKDSENFDCERAIEKVEEYYSDYINVYNNK